ncbi:MAG: BACON domain-containing protein [Porphyromonadaceae bacterium]|nr:BACON domain-containing protein [Porphyromonadaceae bacterium]
MKTTPWLLTLLMIFIIGCKSSNTPDNPIDPKDPKDPKVVDMLDVSLLTINFTSEKDASLIVVKTNTDWTATKTADWLSLSATSGKKNTGFLIGAAKNTGAQRETTVVIRAGDKSKEIKITQAGAP